MKKLLIILGGIFDNNEISTKLKEIEKILLSQNFWKDKIKVKKTVKEKKIFENILNSYQATFQEVKNLKDLYSLALEVKIGLICCVECT